MNYFSKINYYWRLFATGLSFFVFGLGGLLLRLIVFPLLDCFSSNRLQKKIWAQKAVQLSFYAFIGFMHRLGIMTYEINGLKKLNRPHQLIIANHPTLIDIVFLISRIPQANCIVKAALFHNIFTKGPIINAGYISNFDPEEMINACADALKAGETMVVFPEGTRTVEGKKYKFQRGAAAIALQAEAVVTQVTLTCTPSTLTKAQKWYQIPHRKFHLSMNVGDDIVLDEFLAIEQKTIAVRRFNHFIQDYFSQQGESVMSSTMENELKQLIIDSLDLEDISVEEIDSGDALFNEGLGLDSIDALELGLAIRKKFNVRIDAEKDDVEKIFASIASLAGFIESEQAG